MMSVFIKQASSSKTNIIIIIYTSSMFTAWTSLGSSPTLVFRTLLTKLMQHFAMKTWLVRTLAVYILFLLLCKISLKVTTTIVGQSKPAWHDNDLACCIHASCEHPDKLKPGSYNFKICEIFRLFVFLCIFLWCVFICRSCSLQIKLSVYK